MRYDDRIPDRTPDEHAAAVHDRAAKVAKLFGGRLFAKPKPKPKPPQRKVSANESNAITRGIRKAIVCEQQRLEPLVGCEQAWRIAIGVVEAMEEAKRQTPRTVEAAGDREREIAVRLLSLRELGLKRAG